MPELYLPQLGRTIKCERGRNLYELLAEEGLIEAPCGGKGVCGKCRVLLDGAGVLSCCHTVERSAEILLPQAAGVSEIVSDGYMKEFRFVPRGLRRGDRHRHHDRRRRPL
ncbi:MAG: 2Fe-2S iron-sulfur cluster-binding protein [Cloacibacillus evryensis]